MDAKLTREEVLAFLNRHRLAVIATVNADGTPEAALVNIAVSPQLEIVFETTNATRKYANLSRDPAAALVVGWHDDQSLQLNGVVDEPSGRAQDRIKALFVERYPAMASHQVWPGNHYFRFMPSWCRLSNYQPPRRIVELELPQPVRPKPGFWARLAKT